MEMKKSELTHGSLFSGIGGPEIAAEIMGWKNVFHCEINPFGRKILDYWFPNSKSYEDITKTDFTEWRGKINVLTGGFPCQPFSCAGQRKGAEDDRYLWPEMLRAIREIQPDWVVGENVAGILSMVQPGGETALGREESLFGEVDRERILHQQEYVVETVCNDLEREGYSVQPVVIPACAVGAPHRRDRVFFIARRIQDNNNNIGSGYTCRFGRFSVSESMEMEDKQFRVCLQNNQSERRWKEMEDYLDAQIDLLSEGKRGSGPYQQMQNGQQKQNLRILAHWENLHNRKKGSGVRKPKGRNKWHAIIYVNRKRIHLGFFDTKEEAMNARLNAERKLLSTVQTQGLKVCNGNGKTTFYPVELLPTPMSTDIHHAKRVKDLKNAGAKTMASRRNGSNRPNGLMDFMDFHGMLPTPTTSCHNPGTAKDRKDGSPRTSELNHLCARLIGKTSLLNPLFVAEMMGFPPDWTVLPFQSGGRNR